MAGTRAGSCRLQWARQGWGRAWLSPVWFVSFWKLLKCRQPGAGSHARANQLLREPGRSWAHGRLFPLPSKNGATSAASAPHAAAPWGMAAWALLCSWASPQYSTPGWVLRCPSAAPQLIPLPWVSPCAGPPRLAMPHKQLAGLGRKSAAWIVPHARGQCHQHDDCHAAAQCWPSGCAQGWGGTQPSLGLQVQQQGGAGKLVEWGDPKPTPFPLTVELEQCPGAPLACAGSHDSACGRVAGSQAWHGTAVPSCPSLLPGTVPS